jgi:hypothetical protein
MGQFQTDPPIQRIGGGGSHKLACDRQNKGGDESRVDITKVIHQYSSR